MPSLFVFWSFFSPKYFVLARLRVDLLRGPRLPRLFGFEGFILLKSSRFNNYLNAFLYEAGPSCIHLRVRTLLHGRRVSTLLHWAFEIALYWIICRDRTLLYGTASYSTLLHWRLGWDLINRRRRYIAFIQSLEFIVPSYWVAGVHILRQL